MSAPSTDPPTTPKYSGRSRRTRSIPRFAAGRPDAYRVRTAGPGGGGVRTGSGLRLVPDEDLALAGPPHTLVVPGGHGTADPDPVLVRRIAELASGAQRVVSVCTGAAPSSPLAL